MSSRGYPRTRQIMENRRAEAEARQTEYDKLTLQQKIDRLPPEPQAAKQRAKLLALKNKPVEKQVDVSVSEEKKHGLTAKERRAQEKKQ